jgi:hypothetical protein
VVARQAASGMNRWTRVNLLLGAIAAALLTLQLWPAAPTAGTTLTALEAAGISSIRIERSNRLHLAFEHDAGGWRLVHPKQAAAQDHRVQQLLALAYVPVQDDFAADGDLTKYGLDTPEAVLQLDRLRLSFGQRDPSQRSRYVLVDGRVRVIDDVYFNFLTLPSTHFTGD